MEQDRPIQYKVLRFDIEEKDLKENGEFTGYASVFNNVDSHDDVVETGAFKQTLRGNRTRPLMYLHDPFKLLGLAVLDTDDHGLVVNGKMNLAVEFAVDIYNFLKQGALGAMSIGYTSIKHEFEKIKGVQVRKIKELKLFEVSLLPKGFAANDQALITEVKSFDDIRNFILSRKDDHEFKKQILSLFDESPDGPLIKEPIITKSGKPSRYFLEDFQNELKKTKEVLNGR